eukprot:3077702-Pleurochrysis_carterae.AAC.1
MTSSIQIFACTCASACCPSKRSHTYTNPHQHVTPSDWILRAPESGSLPLALASGSTPRPAAHSATVCAITARHASSLQRRLR